MDFGRKRGKPDFPFSGNGGFKKSKEMDSYTTGVGSKSKPCTKFYSTSGCSFGEACHFLHYVPGYSAHTQLANLGENTSVPTRRNSSYTDGPVPTMKTKLCNRINTPEGCRFGDRCNFAHSEMELSRSNFPAYEDHQMMVPPLFESGPRNSSLVNFGSSATAKISIDASFAGAIIGKNGINSKQICRQTGVKLSIKDHETDPNQRNIELEGTFDEIKDASSMVRQLIMNVSATTGRGEKPMSSFDLGSPSSHFKKKMCEKFPKGGCTFGERCHFAHSASELRNPLA